MYVPAGRIPRWRSQDSTRKRQNLDQRPATGTAWATDLMVVSPPDRRRCGEVWGTSCRAWVQNPDFSHGRHGIRCRQSLSARVGIAPPPVLHWLAMSADIEVRQAVAASSHCPPRLLRHLAADPCWEVRRRVAGNCQTPQDTLSRFIDDPNDQVLIHLAGNPQCPSQVLLRLYQLLHLQDDLWFIRALSRRLAANPQCPMVLQQLLA